jgi:hypothetical protein
VNRPRPGSGYQGQFEVDPGVVDVYVGDNSTGGLPGQFTVR